MNASSRFVRVANRRWHLLESGEPRGRTPTVVLDSGVGGFSLTWSKVQRPLSADTRVVSIDRPGYGWSDPLPSGASYAAPMAAERLVEVLHAAQLAGPFVFVGHSYSGFILRQLAARHRALVAGLVLVDVDHEAEWTPRFPEAHRRGLRLLTRASGALAATSRVGVPQLLGKLGAFPLGALLHLEPEERRLTLTRAFRRASLVAAAEEMKAIEPSARAMSQLDSSLGDLPLAVIRRGKPGPFAPGTPPEVEAEIARQTIAVQEELARLSSRGRLYVAEGSGHDVMLEAPEVVIDATRTVLADCLSDSTTRSPSR